MKLEEDKFYRMPLVMGPLAVPGYRPPARFHYKQVEVVSIQYQTDPAAIAPLLPECYRPGESPLVTVVFGYKNQLEFMAGRGCRLAAVQVAARIGGGRGPGGG